MNWFQKSFQFLTQSVSPGRPVPTSVAATSTQATSSTATEPSGNAMAAMAIKTNTLNYVFANTKPDVEYVKGTIAACLNAVSRERAVIKFIVRDNGVESARSKLFQRVLNNPNPLQSRTEFIEELSQFHDATGNGIIMFIKGDANVPAEMWVLPAYYCIALFDKPDDIIPSAYRWADGRVVINNGNLCFVRNTSFKSAPYIGRGALGDMLDTMQLYDFVVKAQQNFFRTGGAPNIALVQKTSGPTRVEPLTSAQIEAMQIMWANKYNPSEGTSNIAVLPDGMEPYNFGAQEINYNASKDEIRDAIREYFQVPKVILGDTDNVNHNNGQTSLAMFERLLILRWGQKVADSLQHWAQREISASLTVEVDPDIESGFTQLPTPRGNVQLPKEFEFIPADSGQINKDIPE